MQGAPCGPDRPGASPPAAAPILTSGGKEWYPWGRSTEASPSGRANERASLKSIKAFERLTVRLAVVITVLVITPLGIGLYILSQHQYQHTIEMSRRAAERQNRVLHTALRHQMMEKDRELLRTLVAEIGTQPDVKDALILNHEGKILYSSDVERVGTSIDRGSPTCEGCHARPPAERESWLVLRDEGGEYLRSVLPIENEPPCHECHDPAEKMNGILILDTSLTELAAGLRRDAAWTFAVTAIIALVLLTGVGLVIRNMILVRLSRLRRAARGLASGDLESRAPVQGSDVITALSQDFNRMAGSVERLVSEVRERESQLASVMNSLDDGLVVLDREFKVVASNLSFGRRVQSYPEGLQGRPCRSTPGKPLPCCQEEAACPAEKCMETGQVQRSVFRVASATKGGSDLVEEVYASPVFDENGKVVQVVEIWRDISERVKEEERLAEIERLVSLGTLASGFSHEVNTPLASMLTCAEAVVSRVDESAAVAGAASTALAEIRDYADVIRNEVHRCRRITEQFLRFSRGIPPSVEPIDLRKAVAGVVSLVEPTAKEARVTIAVEGDGAAPAVTANLEVVHHVLLNILINAIQSFEGGGGSVSVSVVDDGEVRVLVRDTGSGIPEGTRDHIFEPFRTEKPRGTGLGLFLARNFMRRFGGDVRLLESETGVGSCFEVIFARANGGEG